MTKLEQKIIKLGYEERDYIYKIFLKDLFPYYIIIKLENNKISNYAIFSHYFSINSQKGIDALQRVFYIMQKDLEEIRKYEEN